MGSKRKLHIFMAHSVLKNKYDGSCVLTGPGTDGEVQT